MFKREYKLKQHSIMIHFQADPENELNVCLRASEVKPKLDRFLIKKIGGRGKIIGERKKWVRAENTNGIDLSLNYRMTIRCNSGSVTLYESKSRNNKNPENKLPDIFYGNMSNDRNAKLKYGVFWDDGLTVNIQCFNKDLSECIDKYIAEFFAITNFGTMQDKGFGSFTVEGAKVNIPAVLSSNYSADVCYVVNAGRKGGSSYVQNEIFDTIKQVYSVMKSGQNYVGRDGRTITNKYIRSFIYVYMHNKNIGNEKAYMKKTDVAPVRNTHEPKNTHEHHKQEKLGDYRYVRALLGIGEQIEWIEQENEQKTDKTRKERITIADETYPDDKEKNIARFASPVLFKIVDDKIYITADEPNHRIYGRTFRFTNMGYTKKDSGISPRKGNSKTISTLTEEEGLSFDMTDFLKEFMKYYNQKIDERKLRKNHKIEVAR